MRLSQKNKYQKNNPKYVHLLTMALLTLFLAFGSTSCNSAQKKAAAAAAAKKAQAIKKAKTDLSALLNNNSMTSDELERKLGQIKGRNISNPDIAALIKKVEDKIANKKVAEAKAKAEKEKRKKELEAQKAKVEKVKTIHDYFREIAGAGNTNQANGLINDALNLFTSPNANVLIIIAGKGDNADYDKPTTIKKYLNYLKDQKKSPTRIEDFRKDPSGKIKTLILRKL